MFTERAGSDLSLKISSIVDMGVVRKLSRGDSAPVGPPKKLKTMDFTDSGGGADP